MVPKFTPGPWHAGHLGDDTTSCECNHIVSEVYLGAVCTIDVDNGLSISEGGNDAPPRDEAIANMHLIAASPHMFRILGDLLCIDFERFTEHDETLLDHVLKETIDIRRQIMEMEYGKDT